MPFPFLPFAASHTNLVLSSFKMGIVDEIKSNAISTLHLTDDPDEYFADTNAFADAMAANTSIENVILEKHFLSCSVGAKRAQMVSSVGSLSNAKSVTLRDSLLNVGVCVTNLVKNSKSLEELVVENCLLQGSPDHFQLLEEAINGSPSLQNVRIHDCTAPNDKVTLANVFDSIKDGVNTEISGGNAQIQ